MSETIWQALIAAAVTVILAAFQMRTQIVLKKAADQASGAANHAAAQVAEVKSDLQKATTNTDGKLNELAKTADATHEMVNGSMGVQLRLNAIMSKRLAELTNSVEDVEAAELAEKTYRHHEDNLKAARAIAG